MKTRLVATKQVKLLIGQALFERGYYACTFLQKFEPVGRRIIHNITYTLTKKIPFVIDRADNEIAGKLMYDKRVIKTFANLLTSYYSRIGNRIIFRNGATLNRLALSMSEKLNSNFDAATLSRVVSGSRLFTAFQLDAFCAILRLSKSERLTLTKSLAISVLARVHIKRAFLYKKSLYTKFLEFIIKEPHVYVQEWEKSVPELKPAYLIIQKIRDRMQKQYPSLWKHQEEALLCCMAERRFFVFTARFEVGD